MNFFSKLGSNQLYFRSQQEINQKHAYKDKESFKWQRSSEAMEARFGSVMEKLISVCDRESDLFKYIHYKVDQQQRFVVRVNHDRTIVDEPLNLKEHLIKQPPSVSYQVKVQQKGGRKARTANISVRYSRVTI